LKRLAGIDDTDKYIAQGVSYTVVGTNHVIGKKIYKTVINHHVGVNKCAGGDGENFIDRSKFRVTASLMFGAIHVGINEDDFIGEVTKYKLGKVRGICRQWIGITMPLGLKSPKIYGDVYVYDTMILIVFETNIPFNPKYLLTDYRMNVGYDLYPEKGYGMMWYNSFNPDGFIVDGFTSPQEVQVNDQHDEWRCIVGPNGWMVHRSLWDELYRSQADVRVHYRDDIQHQNPPDYYPGDLGYYKVESTVRSLKPRKYQFQLDWYWPYNFYAPDRMRTDIIQEIINVRDNALRVKVGDREATSMSGQPNLVEP